MDEPVGLLPLIKRLIFFIDEDGFAIDKHGGLLREASLVDVALSEFYFSFLLPFFW